MSDMINQIPVPQSGWLVTRLGAPVIALANAINGLRNLRFETSPDSDWHFIWTAGGAVIQIGNIGGLTVQTLDACQTNADGSTTSGTRQVLCGPFVPNS